MRPQFVDFSDYDNFSTQFAVGSYARSPAVHSSLKYARRKIFVICSTKRSWVHSGGNLRLAGSLVR